MKNAYFKYTLSLCSLFLALTVICISLSGSPSPIIKDILAEKGENVNKDSAKQEKVIIIDPGHGGRDPGAVGNGDVLEKDLNLDIAKKLKQALTNEGFSVIMTREEDVLLFDPDIKGSKKEQDLKNRLDIAKECDGAIFVSIHMNKFALESCKGMQVYYSPNNEGSASLALAIKESVNSSLMPENKRATKAANSSIYLLWRNPLVSVLVECGFLSNPEELEKLSNDSYRQALANAVCEGIKNYCSAKGN